MSDLLLTHGYFLGEDPKEQQIMKPYPPLGLLYLSAYLKRAGFGVEVFDSTFGTRAELEARLAGTAVARQVASGGSARGSAPLGPSGARLGPSAAQQGAGVLGIYTNLITRGSVVRIAQRAKALGWTVVLGGPESANYPEEYLARGADVVVVGEGEETMAELLPALASKGPHRLHGVRGTIFRDEDGQVVTNLPRPQIADVDALPWPDRDAIDIQRYVDVWRTHHGAGSVNLITARGCPYKCRWCSHAVFGYTHRRRSPASCAAELESIVERWNPDQVWYADDVFTIHHRWLVEYHAELKKRGLRIPFETISRADRLRGSRAQDREAEDVIETLAKMGCWRLWIGSESGSQKILDAMQRGVTVEEVQWATRAVRRHGIQVGMFLMWGYEGETMDDIAATVEHVKRAGPDVFLTTISYPIMGTPYFQTVKDRVTLAGEWETSTDRDYSVSGRPPKAYYEHADRWLRSEVAAYQESDAARARALMSDAVASRMAMKEILASHVESRASAVPD